MPSDFVVSGELSDQNGAKACLVQCGLCHGTSGAFRKTVKGQWVHAFCAEVITNNNILLMAFLLGPIIFQIFRSGCWTPSM